MHDIRLRYALFGSTHICVPNVHSHRYDRPSLQRRERFQQTYSRRQLPLWHQVQHLRAVNIGQDTCAGVTSFRALFVDAKVTDLFNAALHTTFLGSLYDCFDRVPGQAGERADSIRD